MEATHISDDGAMEKWSWRDHHLYLNPPNIKGFHSVTYHIPIAGMGQVKALINTHEPCIEDASTWSLR